MAKKDGGKWFVITLAAVLAGIWLWAKFATATPTKKGTAVNNTVPVDTGMFFGPEIDAQTGAYLPAGTAPGTTQFNSQPVGPQ
jgi:hypothetical protein